MKTTIEFLDPRHEGTYVEKRSKERSKIIRKIGSAKSSKKFLETNWLILEKVIKYTKLMIRGTKWVLTSTTFF